MLKWYAISGVEQDIDSISLARLTTSSSFSNNIVVEPFKTEEMK